jgi:outer membrane receptor protein involved in Fe transport
LNLGYGIGNLDLSYNLRYLGKQTTAANYEDQHPFNGNPPFNDDAFPQDYFPSAKYHSIRGEYAVNDNLNVFGGVDNLTDELPPLGQLGVAGGDPYDSIGRYFYLGMTVDL